MNTEQVEEILQTYQYHQYWEATYLSCSNTVCLDKYIEKLINRQRLISLEADCSCPF